MGRTCEHGILGGVSLHFDGTT